jgi:xanthine dehydrogenase small subunit
MAAIDLELAQGLDHALSLLSSGDPLVRPVAGATDVVLRLHVKRLQARQLVSIADLPELQWVRADDDSVRFGAGTWLSDLMAHSEVQAEASCLVQAARQFASPQIRNRATVGGNIGNASPAADLVPALIALGAEVTLRSAKRGARSLPLEEIFLGFGKTVISADELITELKVPRRRGWFQSFAKFGSRGANVISVVNTALCLELNGEEISSARVAFGSLAPRPLRGAALEKFLTGKPLSEALIREAREVVLAEVTPIDDVRGTRRYKQKLAVNAVQDALAAAWASVAGKGVAAAADSARVRS